MQENVCSTTVHRGFGIGIDGPSGDFSFAATFDAWFVGEVGMIQRSHLEYVLSCWRSLGREPLLIMEGDFQQLPPSTNSTQDVRDGNDWNPRVLELTIQQRCGDQHLLDFQNGVRFEKPHYKELVRFFAPITVASYLSVEALTDAWLLLPQALVLAATVTTVDFVNKCGLQAFGEEWLGTIPVWSDDNIVDLPLRRGTKIMVTRNTDLSNGIANGTEGVVLAISSAGVIFETSQCIYTLHRRTAIIRGRRLVAWDLAAAYAMTVHKVEGATLPSAILIFEKWSCPGWGYTAITRVRRMSDLLVLGDVGVRHFEPRRR